MTSGPAAPTPVVFDCTVFAQALINPKGPAGACLALGQKGHLRIFLSAHILRELRELPAKIPARLGVTSERVEMLIVDLAKYTQPVEDVPNLSSYKRDPDDAPYVNLALATGANLVVSRDRDLLDLMEPTNDDGVLLRARYPTFQVLTPPALLSEIKS
jgi:uncharacterized protein